MRLRCRPRCRRPRRGWPSTGWPRRALPLPPFVPLLCPSSTRRSHYGTLIRSAIGFYACLAKSCVSVATDPSSLISCRVAGGELETSGLHHGHRPPIAAGCLELGLADHAVMVRIRVVECVVPLLRRDQVVLVPVEAVAAPGAIIALATAATATSAAGTGAAGDRQEKGEQAEPAAAASDQGHLHRPSHRPVLRPRRRSSRRHLAGRPPRRWRAGRSR